MQYALPTRSALRALVALAVATVAFAAAAAPAQAQQAPLEPQVIRLEPGDGTPRVPGAAPQGGAHGDPLPEVQKAIAEHGPAEKQVLAPLDDVGHPLRYEIS